MSSTVEATATAAAATAPTELVDAAGVRFAYRRLGASPTPTMSDRIDHDRRRFLGGAAVTIATARSGILAAGLQQLACARSASAGGGVLFSLSGATGWLNSPALTAESLRGKVVLVNFCTYTCINWLRSLPYVRAWAERYRDHGLVVIGAHTPEFSFEHEPENVRRALAPMGVTYPIALDNDYAVWRGFGNRAWPAVYVLDAQGRLRHRHFGEGEYEATERMIRRLLDEAGRHDVGPAPAAVEARGVEAPADWDSLRTPETYVGGERGSNFASPGGLAVDERRVYASPPRLPLNHWALAGDWTVGQEATVLNAAGGRIAFRFHARDLHLVMGRPEPGAPVPFRIRVDGRPPDAARGGDVDALGDGAVADQRLYQLLRQHESVADRVLEIVFGGPGVGAYVFTFG
jgi:thiol-disulfide isomerase/thioredoxin